MVSRVLFGGSGREKIFMKTAGFLKFRKVFFKTSISKGYGKGLKSGFSE